MASSVFDAIDRMDTENDCWVVIRDRRFRARREFHLLAVGSNRRVYMEGNAFRCTDEVGQNVDTPNAPIDGDISKLSTNQVGVMPLLTQEQNSLRACPSSCSHIIDAISDHDQFICRHSPFICDMVDSRRMGLRGLELPGNDRVHFDSGQEGVHEMLGRSVKISSADYQVRDGNGQDN